MLWRIRKDGHDSYLYGTLHVGRSLWIAPGPKLAAALRASDALALELDPLDPQVQATMRASLAQRPEVALPAALRQRLDQQLARECLTAMAADLGPAEMQVMGLATLVGRRAGYDPSFGSEVLLSAMARQGGMPVLSLETVDQQLDALLAPDAAQAVQAVEEGLDDLESGRQARVLLATVKAWEQSDAAALENYAAWCECTDTPLAREQMHRLLDQRNPLMARAIDQLHREGKRVLAAVGSLHMVGPRGLPAVLAKQGYTVQRLQ
ncbi:MAG: TraB/GumN family protein [Rhodoferax sp.]|nr:TraB/GumN family protein [Rhodoferax sp.]